MTHDDAGRDASPAGLTAELLPCPWCGGPAELEEVDAPLDRRRWSVGCKEKELPNEVSAVECMGYQSLTSFATKREAIAAWNRRSPAATENEWFAGAVQPSKSDLYIAFVPPNIMGLACFIDGRWFWPREGEDQPVIGMTHWRSLPSVPAASDLGRDQLSASRFELGQGNSEAGAAARAEPAEEEVERVGNALQDECGAMFGQAWSDDVAEAFARAAIAAMAPSRELADLKRQVEEALQTTENCPTLREMAAACIEGAHAKAALAAAEQAAREARESGFAEGRDAAAQVVDQFDGKYGFDRNTIALIRAAILDLSRGGSQ